MGDQQQDMGRRVPPGRDIIKRVPGYRTLSRFSNRLSLANRILAVNIFAILLLVAGLLFLDNYRERLFEERLDDARSDVAILAALSSELDDAAFRRIMDEEVRVNKSRIRIYGADGRLGYDSFVEGKRAYELRGASDEDFIKHLARGLDRAVDFLLLKGQPPQYVEPEVDRFSSWPILRSLKGKQARSQLFYSGDFTPVILGAAQSADGERTVLLTRNPRAVRRIVRAERFDIFLFAGIVVLISIMLSLFLARTLVTPLLELTRAAIKVRRGRERQVKVPRLPRRRDEIGLLARAVADMTESLRDRIDATEAFAADVAHEIKNPIASLRSALEGLRRIEDPALRKQLLDVADDDVRRMDRLISDISEVSRVDSELTRTRFEPVDIGEIIEQLIAGREQRTNGLMAAKGVKIAFARPRKGSAVVMGEDMRLARVLDNLIDNAISFSPHGGLVEIIATDTGEQVLIRVQDEGPGVMENERETIFHRFYTSRPPDMPSETGRHSGLGLAIARTIVEGHQGSIKVRDRDDGRLGALFEVRLPSARNDENG